LAKNHGVKTLSLPVHQESTLYGYGLRGVPPLYNQALQKMLAHEFFGRSGNPFAAQGIPKPPLRVWLQVGIWPIIELHLAKVM